VLLADQGSAKDLRGAVEATARQARELRADGAILLEELLTTGGPFPQRLHLTERVVSLYGEFVRLLVRWCDETLDEVDSWPDTVDVGLTPRARQRLEELLAHARQDQ
jgi:hypothetical protein